MSHESSSAISNRAISQAQEIAELKREVERLRKEVFAAINIFQDIWSWQPGESRNALVCEIRDKVDALFARAASKPTVTPYVYPEAGCHGI